MTLSLRVSKVAKKMKDKSLRVCGKEYCTIYLCTDMVTFDTSLNYTYVFEFRKKKRMFATPRHMPSSKYDPAPYLLARLRVLKDPLKGTVQRDRSGRN
jgi:hypothetical protein